MSCTANDRSVDAGAASTLPTQCRCGGATLENKLAGSRPVRTDPFWLLTVSDRVLTVIARPACFVPLQMIILQEKVTHGKRPNGIPKNQGFLDVCETRHDRQFI